MGRWWDSPWWGGLGLICCDAALLSDFLSGSHPALGYKSRLSDPQGQVFVQHNNGIVQLVLAMGVLSWVGLAGGVGVGLLM